MDEDACDFLGVGNFSFTRLGHNPSAIADLTAAFGVERGLVDHDLHLAGGFVDLCALGHKRGDLTFRGLGVVAQEFGRAELLGQIEPDRGIRGLARPGPAGARLGLLLFHCGVEPFGIDLALTFAQRILRQIEREAERVIEFERSLAR